MGNNTAAANPPTETADSTPNPVPDVLTPTHGSKGASEHLSRQLTTILQGKTELEGYRVDLVDDNLYKWRVHLFDFPQEAQISEDLKLYKSATNKDTVCMEVLFPQQYPGEPPFIRIVYPRFHQYTGHITIGGSICVKELTKSGWQPSYDLSQFIIMIRDLLVAGGALVDMDSAQYEYTEDEAKEAFIRVAQAHGWKA